MKAHRELTFAACFLLASGVAGQYEFTLTCIDTVATIVPPVDEVVFSIRLENTGSTDDVYRITLSNRTPGWLLAFCVGGICCPAGGVIYDTLMTEDRETIEVKFLDISEPDTGSGILCVQSLGDAGKSDSVILWVMATTSIQTETGVDQVSNRFLHSFPNPFFHSTAVVYHLSDDQNVSLRIHDIEGRLVRTIVNGGMDAGRHTHRWGCKDTKRRRVAPGIYFCVLRTKEYVSVCKMILLQ